MNAKKKILRAAAIIFGICFILASASIIYLESFSKPEMERLLSNTLRMELKIEGKMSMRPIPIPGRPAAVLMESVVLRNHGEEIAKAAKVDLSISLLSLLRRKVNVTDLKMTDAFFRIRKEKGVYNFQTGQAPSPKFMTMSSIKRLSIIKGRITYEGEDGQRALDAKNVDALLAVEFRPSESPRLLDRISFSGDCNAGAMRLGAYDFSGVGFGVKTDGRVIEIPKALFTLYGGKGRGAVTFDYVKDPPAVTVKAQVTGLKTGEWVASFSDKEILKGNVELTTHVSMRGSTALALKKTMDGTIGIRGNDLNLYRIDLDDFIKKYERSQNLNLIDVAAFAFLGPLGSGLSSGYKFAELFAASTGGKTDIERLSTLWKVRDGVAEAQDVAMTTKQNRVAMKGNIDLVAHKYKNVVIAPVDEKGCPKFTENIEGPFGKPKVERMSAIKPLLGPAVGLIKKAGRILKGGKCEPFYSGSLPHPEKEKALK